MIRVENLKKYYGDFQALKGIDFEIDDGEIVGFLGANGAGKSTTLKVMTGYLAPSAGNVFMDDLNIQAHSLAIRQQIGYLPEMNPLYGEMRVYDYLEFTSQIRGMSPEAFKTALDRVVDQCGLREVIHLPISACSKGYKQRIGISAAILHDPRVLIFDEPVSGLDPNQIVEIRNLIRELGQHKMLIISSHILQEIEATVDRIVIIDHGEIVANGTSRELMSGFQGRTQLTLDVKYADEASIAGLARNIDEIEVADAQAVDGRSVLSIEYTREVDPREAIFEYAKNSGWAILEMTQHQVHLEDVFRGLTGEGGGHA